MNHRGFTLAELLVVIAIIGILAATVMASLNRSRAKARDVHRIAAFREFEKALLFYYDKYAAYPCGDVNHGTGTADGSGSFLFLNGGATSNCRLDLGPTTGLYTEGFLNSDWPKDPINSSSQHYRIVITNDRQLYVLYVPLENGNDLQTADGGLCDNYYEVGPGTGVQTPFAIPGVPCN